MIAGTCFAAGMMSYELLAFHLITTKIVAVKSIPLLLAFGTGSGVIANLVLGKLYDRFELPTVLGAVFLSALFSPLIFFGGFYGVLAGVVLLGIAYATEDTLITAIIAGAYEGKTEPRLRSVLSGIWRRMARGKHRHGTPLWLVIALPRCFPHDRSAFFAADLLHGDTCKTPLA
jgi:MFS family permease